MVLKQTPIALYTNYSNPSFQPTSINGYRLTLLNPLSDTVVSGPPKPPSSSPLYGPPVHPASILVLVGCITNFKGIPINDSHDSILTGNFSMVVKCSHV